MAVDVAKLKQLREETGVSFSVVKQALEEADNDVEKARALIAKNGESRVEKKLGNETGNGVIFSYVHHNGKVGTLIELKCQTDFVARTDDFMKLGKELAMQVAVTTSTTPEELLGAEYWKNPKQTVTELIKESILKTGENISVARIQKWEA
jgi:elongation factor Ts